MMVRAYDETVQIVRNRFQAQNLTVLAAVRVVSTRKRIYHA